MKYLLLLFAFSLSAGIENHYKKLENKQGCIPPDGIDYVYMINLDTRPERWAKSAGALAAFAIFPERFPGIYGWTLPVEVLNDMSLQFKPGMWRGKEWVMVYPPEKRGDPDFIWLNESWYGKGCFSGWTVKGTIGCSLSHLSVLKDAYDSGYETIWILEDDISILQDPNLLSDLIAELDWRLIDSEEWDVLYTDLESLTVDLKKPLEEQIPYMWRPDMVGLDISFLAQHTPLSDHFLKIGSRMRAHSIIYRRCGIKKILDFYREYNNFLPYDQELALVPGIQTYVLCESVVSVQPADSDTRYRYFRNN